MIKKRIITGVVGTVLVVGFWMLLDFLYTTLITRSGFTFEWGSDIIIPLVVGMVVFFVLIPMYDKDMNKSRVKYEALKEKQHQKAPTEEEQK